MDASYWFNISRFFTLVGGILTVLGGFGLYHFGHLKETKTKETISKNEESSQKAKAVAASANEKAQNAKLKTKELELDVIESRKETALAEQKTEKFRLAIQQANENAENAKLKTERLKLEVGKATLNAEKAKLEREKLKQQTLILEKQNIELKVESDRIKSFTIKVALLIDDNQLTEGFVNNHFVGVVGYVNLIKSNKIEYKFIAKQPFQTQRKNDGMFLMLFEFEPLRTDILFTKPIQVLESIQSLSIDLGATIKRENIIPIAPMNCQVICVLNGINIFVIEGVENGIATMSKTNPLLLSVKEQFRNVTKIYKEATKN